MIDEFQDTSRMQWDNFRLLLLEGLSQGADRLIVGDVKQSIYRWRNGDWGIPVSYTHLGMNGEGLGISDCAINCIVLIPNPSSLILPP